jgi:beta-glucosidase
VEDQKYTSKYIDSPKDPLYPFGYGLSYSDFEYSPIIINRSLMSEKDTLTAKVNVKNTGKYTGDEVVQLYIRDMVGTLTRPLKELKGFSKIELKPGESKEVVFKLTVNDLKFYGPDMEYIYEPGDFKLFIGRNSMDASEVEFRLKND